MSDFSKLPSTTPSLTTPPVAPAPSKPTDDESTPAPRSQESIDKALDDAMESKTASLRKVVDKDRPLKKQFDDDIEAEMNEFLNAFDTKTLEAVLPAPKGVAQWMWIDRCS